MANGLLRVVSEQELQQADTEEARKAEAAAQAQQDVAVDTLAGYIRQQFYNFRDHRLTQSLPERYLDALRAYNGEYSANKLAEIKKFGGSDVFSRITSVKCRGATALLRDVFLGSETPWYLAPTPDPVVPDLVGQDIRHLVAMEASALAQSGVPVTPEVIAERLRQLETAASRASRKLARDEAKEATRKLNDILVEGGFYDALAEFLVDLPIMPFACIKGPIVQNSTEVKWVNGQAQITTVPKMYWRRVSAFDLFFTPGASKIEDAAILERIRLSRAELNSLLGVPGYDDDAIRGALRDYSRGMHDWLDNQETERAYQEDKENPYLNRSELLDTLEWTGPIQGKLLRDHGFTDMQIPDPDRDYMVTAWIIGRYVIKVHLNPNPRQRHNYFLTSFEKVPGSIIGHALPDIISDMQSVANATLRALVNNMSIASGPQVAINEDLLAPTADGDALYPWKRWRFSQDPMGQTQPPIAFFQPESNANELLAVYQAMSNIADEVSAIPRYITGNERVGGAARTASGLSMLMNNASKVLQSVAAQIDKDILDPVITLLYDMIMLSDTTGTLRGDENIQVRGVTMAMQKETDRMRQLEFLQITGNPVDMQIIGQDGRASVLRSLADNLGLDAEQIVPSEEELKARQTAMAQLEEQAAQAQGAQPPAPGSTGAGRLGEETDNAQRVVMQ